MLQGLRLESIPLADVPSGEGRYPAWRVTFVSPGRRQSKSVTCSVVEAHGNLHKGIFQGLEESWSPGGGARTSLVAALLVDPDTAYKRALSESAACVKKNPDEPVTMLLEWTSRRPNLTWRVIWGQCLSTSDYWVFVDAYTGDSLGKLQ